MSTAALVAMIVAAAVLLVAVFVIVALVLRRRPSRGRRAAPRTGPPDSAVTRPSALGDIAGTVGPSSRLRAEAGVATRAHFGGAAMDATPTTQFEAVTEPVPDEADTPILEVPRVDTGEAQPMARSDADVDDTDADDADGEGKASADHQADEGDRVLTSADETEAPGAVAGAQARATDALTQPDVSATSAAVARGEHRADPSGVYERTDTSDTDGSYTADTAETVDASESVGRADSVVETVGIVDGTGSPDAGDADDSDTAEHAGARVLPMPIVVPPESSQEETVTAAESVSAQLLPAAPMLATVGVSVAAGESGIYEVPVAASAASGVGTPRLAAPRSAQPVPAGYSDAAGGARTSPAVRRAVFGEQRSYLSAPGGPGSPKDAGEAGVGGPDDTVHTESSGFEYDESAPSTESHASVSDESDGQPTPTNSVNGPIDGASNVDTAGQDYAGHANRATSDAPVSAPRVDGNVADADAAGPADSFGAAGWGMSHDGPEEGVEKPPVTCGVRGRVRRTDGIAVEDAVVTLIDLGGRQVERAATDTNGAYQVTAFGDGRYVLITSADTYQPQAATVDLGNAVVELDIVLSGAGVLRGVACTPDGTPVRGATAVLADVHGDVVASAVTMADGEYAFEQLVAGTYTLAVSAEAYRPVARAVQVEESGETRADAELVGAARLRGFATGGPDQRPIPDALVTVLDSEGTVVAVTTTGLGGEYTIEDLPQGDYTVVATGYPPVANQIRLAGGETGQYDVEFQHQSHNIA